MIFETRQDNEQIVDRANSQEVKFAGVSEAAKQKAKALTELDPGSALAGLHDAGEDEGT